MDLVGQIKAILKHDGLKRKTRRVALKETIEYYRKDLQHRISNAKEMQEKAGFSEIYLQRIENEKLLFEKVLKGKTTYQKEVSKLTKDPYENEKRRKKEQGYFKLENTVMSLFSMFYDDMEREAKLLDKTIKSLYGG